MIQQNPTHPSSSESTISRQTRNAFLIAIILSIAITINFFLSLRIALGTRDLVSFGDTIIVFSFLVTTITSAGLIRNGQKEKGVWLLLIAFAVTLALRNMLNEGLGIILGLLAATLIPLLGLLTLKPASFNKTLILGFLSGSFDVAFDIVAPRYLPHYRQSAENIIPLTRSATILGIIIAAVFIITLIRQNRSMLLSSKLTLAMVGIVLLPLVILSVVSTGVLQETLNPRQKESVEQKALSLARDIGYFAHTDKNTVRAEAQTPILAAYLAADQDQDEALREEALETLRSFKRRNILHIRSYAILDDKGVNILDTAPWNIGENERDTTYFTHSLETGEFFISEVSRTNPDESFSFFISSPIVSKTGETLGVLRAEYDIEVLQEFVNAYLREENTIDREVFAAVFYPVPLEQSASDAPSSAYLILANTKAPTLNFLSVTPLSSDMIAFLQETSFLPADGELSVGTETPGLDAGLRNHETASVFKAQAFPRTSDLTTPLDLIASVNVESEDDNQMPSWVVVTSQDMESLDEPLQGQRATLTLITLIISISAAILAYIGSRYLLQPITLLTNTANEISQGNFQARAPINTEDEIGWLGQSFNSMTAQLENLIATLEERVASRTHELERRSQQLRAAVDVGKVAVSLHTLDDLLSQAAELISQRFGFYHVGIFLLEQENKFAVLKAANSAGGARMLARNHQLKVGEVGIVGYVTNTGRARIALDVGQDAAYFDNPDLPETRSEMALPLIASGKILGALDIQSTEGEAFKEADIATLQVLADQIAISIENARLFEENRNALQALRKAYGEESHIGWQEFAHQERNPGYLGKRDGSVVPLGAAMSATFREIIQQNRVVLDGENLVANIPIAVRGKPVGAIRLSKPASALPWKKDELEFARTLTTELGNAMDSARLFDETRKQVEKERIVGEITARMRETLSVDAVMKIAADEIYKLLDLEELAIHFTPDDNSDEQEELA